MSSCKTCKALSRSVAQGGRVLVNFVVCQACGYEQLSMVPETRGFEHIRCINCGAHACDEEPLHSVEVTGLDLTTVYYRGDEDDSA